MQCLAVAVVVIVVVYAACAEVDIVFPGVAVAWATASSAEAASGVTPAAGCQHHSFGRDRLQKTQHHIAEPDMSYQTHRSPGNTLIHVYTS